MRWIQYSIFHCPLSGPAAVRGEWSFALADCGCEGGGDDDDNKGEQNRSSGWGQLSWRMCRPLWKGGTWTQLIQLGEQLDYATCSLDMADQSPPPPLSFLLLTIESINSIQRCVPGSVIITHCGAASPVPPLTTHQLVNKIFILGTVVVANRNCE